MNDIGNGRVTFGKQKVKITTVNFYLRSYREHRFKANAFFADSTLTSKLLFG